MYLLIYLEILLLVATILIVVMKRRITSLMKENLKLHEKLYRLKNGDKEKALESDEPYWQKVYPEEFVEELKDRSATLLN